MKKVFKNPILMFMIGAILSGTIVYAGTMIARDITFDNTKSQLKDSNNQNVDNVQDAIDALYTKANNQTTYDEYNGTTTYTPSTSTQTIPTNNKLLKSNITINPIPSTYKNLIELQNELTASDLISGKRAYDHNGNIVLGTHDDCIKKEITINSTVLNEPIFSFIPTTFFVHFIYPNSSIRSMGYYNSTLTDNPIFYFNNEDVSGIFPFGNGDNSVFNIVNNNLMFSNASWWNTMYNGKMYLIACR